LEIILHVDAIFHSFYELELSDGSLIFGY